MHRLPEARTTLIMWDGILQWLSLMVVIPNPFFG